MTPRAAGTSRRIWALRVAFVAVALVAWEALAASGLLFRDVVPSLAAIATAVARVLGTPDFYANLAVTAQEIGIADADAGTARLPTATMDAASNVIANLLSLPMTSLLFRWLRDPR